MRKNKKANSGFSTIIMLIVAIVGGLLIISIIAYILRAVTDPNRVQEGIGCRIMIQATARIESATSGFVTAQKLMSACRVIEAKIPRKQSYPQYGGDVNHLSIEQFRNVVAFDMAEMVNNAWWVSGEGDRAEYFLQSVMNVFVGSNKCRIIYAVKIEAPKQYAQSSFTRIEEDYLTAQLSTITRSDVLGGDVKGDQRPILEYITFDGKGAGLFLRSVTADKSGNVDKVDPGWIELTNKGTDAIYGIAVGFFKTSAIVTWLDKMLAGKKASIKSANAGYILIAPFSQLASICAVTN